MECLQRLHDAVTKRMDQLVEATVLEYGAPQDRAKDSNSLAANIFLHFKEVLKNFDLVKIVGKSKVVMEPVGVVGIFTPWNSSAGPMAIKVAPAIVAGRTVVIKPSEMSAMQTEVLMEAFHEAGFCKDASESLPRNILQVPGVGSKNHLRFCYVGCPFAGHFRVSSKHARSRSFSVMPIQHTLCRIQERASPRQRRAVVPGHPIRRRLLQLLRAPL
jgi:hypothetical protein